MNCRECANLWAFHTGQGCLENLNLGRCSLITDLAVHALAEKCTGLKCLDLSICTNVTDDAIVALARSCGGLEELGLRFCSLHITDKVRR